MAMLVALLLQAIDPAALIATERARTAAETQCVVDPDSTDITVCGLRNADRFRVPFHSRALAWRDDVPGERAALIHRNSPLADLSPFLVGGGMAGVRAGIGLGPGGGSGEVDVGGLRPLAP